MTENETTLKRTLLLINEMVLHHEKQHEKHGINEETFTRLSYKYTDESIVNDMIHDATNARMQKEWNRGAAFALSRLREKMLADKQINPDSE